MQLFRLQPISWFVWRARCLSSVRFSDRTRIRAEFIDNSIEEMPGVPSHLARLSHAFRSKHDVSMQLTSIRELRDDVHRREEFRAMMLTAYELKSPLISVVFEQYRDSIMPLVSDFTLLLDYAVHVARSLPVARRVFAEVQAVPGFQLSNEPRLLSLMMEALSLANDTDGILQLFETQKAAGIRLQMHIYPIVVNALLKKHRFTDATLLFTEVSDFAMQSEWRRSIRPRLLLAMTRGFAVAGKIDEGWKFLSAVRDSMRSALHDESIPVFVFAPLLWGMAISNNATTHQNNVISAIHEISSAFGTSLDSNSILPPLLQHIVGSARDLPLAVHVFECAIEAKLINPASMAIIFHALCKAGQIDQALRLFEYAFQTSPELLCENNRNESKRNFFNFFFPTDSLSLPDTSLDTQQQHSFYKSLFPPASFAKLEQLRVEASPIQPTPFPEFMDAVLKSQSSSSVSSTRVFKFQSTFSENSQIRLPLSSVLLRIMIDGCIACEASSSALAILKRILGHQHLRLIALDSRYLSRFLACYALHFKSQSLSDLKLSSNCKLMQKCEEFLKYREETLLKVHKAGALLPDRNHDQHEFKNATAQHENFLADSVYNVMIQGYCRRHDFKNVSGWLRKLNQGRVDGDLSAVISVESVCALMKMCNANNSLNTTALLEQFVLSSKFSAQSPSRRPLVAMIQMLSEALPAYIGLNSFDTALARLRQIILSTRQGTNERAFFYSNVQNVINNSSLAVRQKWLQLAWDWRRTTHKKDRDSVEVDEQRLMIDFLWHLSPSASATLLDNSKVGSRELFEQISKEISALNHTIAVPTRTPLKPSKGPSTSLQPSFDALFGRVQSVATFQAIAPPQLAHIPQPNFSNSNAIFGSETESESRTSVHHHSLDPFGDQLDDDAIVAADAPPPDRVETHPRERKRISSPLDDLSEVNRHLDYVYAHVDADAARDADFRKQSQIRSWRRQNKLSSAQSGVSDVSDSMLQEEPSSTGKLLAKGEIPWDLMTDFVAASLLRSAEDLRPKPML